MRLLPITIAVCLLAITGCLCACLLSLQATLAYAPRAFVETRAALVQETQTTRNQALAQLSRVVDGDPKAKSAAGKLPLRELLVSEVDRKAGETLTAATSQLNQLRADLLEGDNSVAGRMDAKTGKVVTLATDLQKQLKPSIGNLEKISAAGAEIAKHTASMTAHVDDTLPQFTDCVYLDDNGDPSAANPDCLFNRYQGVSKAAEQMFQEGAKAAPKLAKSSEGIAEDIKKEADQLTGPKTFMQKVSAWIQLFARAAAAFL